MKLKLKFYPDAVCSYDTSAEQVTVDLSPDGSMKAAVAVAEVVGDGGQRNRYRVYVDARSGQLKLSALLTEVAPFDESIAASKDVADSQEETHDKRSTNK